MNQVAGRPRREGRRDPRRRRRVGRVRAGADVPRRAGGVAVVREGPDREPRRDRPAGRARVPRARDQVGRRLLDRRRGVGGGQVRRRGGADRAPRRRPELPPHPEHHRRGAEDRRRRDPSRLRLPLRGPVLRRDLRGRGDHVHRPEAGRDGEGRRQGDGAPADVRGRPAAPARHGRAGQHARRGARRRGRDRLPGDHQGGRGRRRARHERRPPRRRARVAVPDDPRDRAGGLQGQRRLHRALPRDLPPHRDPARLRPARQRRLLRRARLLGPAPPPEADRGGAVDPPVRGDPPRGRRGRRPRRPLRRLHGRGNDGVPARPRRQPLLHGDERADPGRAPGLASWSRAPT